MPDNQFSTDLFSRRNMSSSRQNFLPHSSMEPGTGFGGPLLPWQLSGKWSDSLPISLILVAYFHICLFSLRGQITTRFLKDFLTYFRSQMDQISNTFSLAVQLTFASTNEQPDDNDTSIKRAKILRHWRRSIFIQTFVREQFVQVNITNAWKIPRLLKAIYSLVFNKSLSNLTHLLILRLSFQPCSRIFAKCFQSKVEKIVSRSIPAASHKSFLVNYNLYPFSQSMLLFLLPKVRLVTFCHCLFSGTWQPPNMTFLWSLFLPLRQLKPTKMTTQLLWCLCNKV